jgi:hypothetical protein
MKELSVHEIGKLEDRNYSLQYRSKASGEVYSRKQSQEQGWEHDSRRLRGQSKPDDLSDLLGNEDSERKFGRPRSDIEEYLGGDR